MKGTLASAISQHLETECNGVQTSIINNNAHLLYWIWKMEIVSLQKSKLREWMQEKKMSWLTQVLANTREMQNPSTWLITEAIIAS